MHSSTVVYLTIVAEAFMGVAILLFTVLIAWEVINTVSDMWKRSDTLRPFIISVFAASLALLMLNQGKGTFRDTFSDTFDFERTRAREQI